MIEARNYNITIRRDVFDGEACYEARVRELPDLAEYGDTADEAYALALDAIETTAAVLADKGRAMPSPEAPETGYSGRVTLRLPKSLHRALAVKADDEGISLNQLMLSVLASFRGFSHALEDSRGEWESVQTSQGAVRQKKPASVIPLRAVSGRLDEWQAANG